MSITNKSGGMGERKSSFVMKIDSETDTKVSSGGGGGGGGGSGSHFRSQPTRLTLQARRGSGETKSVGMPGEDMVGEMPTDSVLDPISVSCGANFTAAVISNTMGMREIGFGGRVFVFGSNVHGQLGDVSR
jgi:hypothetical protein